MRYPDLELSRKAWLLRTKGRLSFVDIARLQSTDQKTAARRVRYYANHHAEDSALPERLTLGEMAYLEYVDGLSWREVGEELGISRKWAWMYARNYAKKKGLSWPPARSKT